MPDSVGLILFVSEAASDHPLLQEMQIVRQACAYDTLERAMETQSFDPIVVATNDRAWVETLGSLPVTIDFDAIDVPFHFGRRLAEVIGRYHLQRALYLGAASAPLLSASELRNIADEAGHHNRVVIANNINSTDWTAIAPAVIVRDWIDQLPNDNSLGWVLSHDAGLEPMAWPSSAATRLDIDVPIDAQIAALHPQCGPQLREAVRRLPWDDRRLRAAREILKTPATRLILAGRVPAWAWAKLEQTVQCWTRVYSEERGMRAAGRLGAGQVRSLLNDQLHALGLRPFITNLCSMADAILWDTRVLWAAKGAWPSEVDRYAADLGLIEYITDAFIRNFTQAVLEAPIPIVTGGHALVSGGLWALLEAMNNDQ